MKMSIITVSKNSAKSIENTIKSVITQKKNNSEYIVIDGLSTDNTVEIVRSFGDSIDYFVSENDSGISEAFNKGIVSSCGDIVSIINSDDCLLPGTIELVIDFFNEHPETQVLHGDVLLFRGNDFVKRVKPAGRWWYPWRLVLFNHPATFVRKHVYEKHGMFSLDYRIAMDIDIFLRWTRSRVKIFYLKEPLVAMHYGGLSDRQPFHGYLESRKAHIDNGYPRAVVDFLLVCKCVLHCFGRIHAAFLIWLQSYSSRKTRNY